MNDFLTIDDLELLWRPLSSTEKKRANALIEMVSDVLREEAYKYGKDLDEMVERRNSYKSVLKSVMSDIISRMLLTSTEDEPLSQFSQSALGYSVSGTYLVPGGGLFIKNSELKRLGLKRQRYGVIDFYENTGDNY